MLSERQKEVLLLESAQIGSLHSRNWVTGQPFLKVPFRDVQEPKHLNSDIQKDTPSQIYHLGGKTPIKMPVCLLRKIV